MITKMMIVISCPVSYNRQSGYYTTKSVYAYCRAVPYQIKITRRLKMKKAKKILPVILCLALCLSLFASCKGKTPETSAPATSGGPVYKEEMIVVLDNNKVSTIDVYNSASSAPGALWTFRMIYDTLVESAGEGKYKENLATKWETEDAKTYTFHLRNDVKFHNGEKFTANDVLYTINKARAAEGTLVKQQWDDVDTINVIDQYTIQFVLKEVNVEFLFRVSHPAAGIVNEKAITGNPANGSWIGTGPYKVTDFSTNDFIKMTRNDDYWGQKALTKKVTLQYIPEASTRLMMLENDEIDVCFGIDEFEMPRLIADTAKFTSFKTVMDNTSMIGFNTNDPITGDRNFRMAVISAIDIPAMVKVSMGEFAEVNTSGTYWGVGTAFRNASIPGIPFNVEKAKEYLAASTYDGSTVEISFGIPPAIISAEFIQQALKGIGVNAEINQFDMVGLSAHTKYGENESQIIVHITPWSKSAVSANGVFKPGGVYNLTSYNNPEVTQLLEQATTVYDANQRKELYYRVQELVAYDVPFYATFFMHFVAVCRSGVGGVIISGDSQNDLRYVHRIIG